MYCWASLVQLSSNMQPERAWREAMAWLGTRRQTTERFQRIRCPTYSPSVHVANGVNPYHRRFVYPVSGEMVNDDAYFTLLSQRCHTQKPEIGVASQVSAHVEIQRRHHLEGNDLWLIHNYSHAACCSSRAWR